MKDLKCTQCALGCVKNEVQSLPTFTPPTPEQALQTGLGWQLQHQKGFLKAVKRSDKHLV